MAGMPRVGEPVMEQEKQEKEKHIPSLCNNDVVNRVMTLPEAGETDTDDHCAHWEGELYPKLSVFGGGGGGGR